MEKYLDTGSELTAEEYEAFSQLAARKREEMVQHFKLADRINREFEPEISDRVIEEGFAIEGDLISPDSFRLVTGEFAQPVDTGIGVVEKIVPPIRLSPAGPVEMDFVHTSTDLAEGVFGIPGNVDRINRTTIIRSRVDSSWSGDPMSLNGASMGHSVKFTPNNWVEVFYRFRPEIHIEANGFDVANGHDARLLFHVYASIEYFDPASGTSAGFWHPRTGYLLDIKSVAKLLAPGKSSMSGFLTMPSELSQAAMGFLISGRRYLSQLTCTLMVQTTKPGNGSFNINADAKVSLV